MDRQTDNGTDNTPSASRPSGNTEDICTLCNHSWLAFFMKLLLYQWAIKLALTCGTALFPKMDLSTAIDRPTITSSLTFSIMAAASPATSANNTGALYRFQNRNSSPRLAVVLPTWPNKLAFGSQNMRSKHNTTYNIG